MLKRKIVLFLVVFILAGKSFGQPGLSLVIYSNFADPQRTYESLISKFVNTGLVDSLKIIGRPISAPSVGIEIDSQLVELYGISYEEIEKVLSGSDTLELHELLALTVSTDSGDVIAFNAIGTVYSSISYYKPEIFIPKPGTYTYHNMKCVRVEFYCKKNDRQKLKLEVSKILKSYVDRDSYQYPKTGIEFDFVK